MNSIEHLTAPLVQVSTTVDSSDAAAAMAQTCVEARLAACVQIIGPMTSVYHWQGRIETATEWLLLLKTTPQRVDDLLRLVRANHTYETPEVIATPITAADADYLSWVRTETATNHQ